MGPGTHNKVNSRTTFRDDLKVVVTEQRMVGGRDEEWGSQWADDSGITSILHDQSRKHNLSFSREESCLSNQ